MYRFLLSRRWVGFAVLVVVLAALFVQLGQWQFSRLSDRHAGNAVTERNLAAEPVAVDRLIRPGEPVPEDLQWRRVTATGTFDVSAELLVRYQTRDGKQGVDVLTPLVTDAGAALLVNRGWLAASNDPSNAPDVPPPPRGKVRVTGWLRTDQHGDAAALTPDAGQVRLVSGTAIGSTLPYPVYRGFVEMTGVNPPPAQLLAPAEAPEINSGPHFFYGLQWYFFAALAVGGICYFAWSEAAIRRGRAQEAARPVREDAPIG